MYITDDDIFNGIIATILNFVESTRKRRDVLKRYFAQPRIIIRQYFLKK